MSEVVSLSQKRQEKENKKNAAEELEEYDPDKELTEDEVKAKFEETMKKNEAIKQKMAKERLAANKSVLRSYRIKN